MYVVKHILKYYHVISCMKSSIYKHIVDNEILEIVSG